MYYQKQGENHQQSPQDWFIVALKAHANCTPSCSGSDAVHHQQLTGGPIASAPHQPAITCTITQTLHDLMMCTQNLHAWQMQDMKPYCTRAPHCHTGSIFWENHTTTNTTNPSPACCCTVMLAHAGSNYHGAPATSGPHAYLAQGARPQAPPPSCSNLQQRLRLQVAPGVLAAHA